MMRRRDWITKKKKENIKDAKKLERKGRIL
jgi:hypothetical protein